MNLQLYRCEMIRKLLRVDGRGGVQWFIPIRAMVWTRAA